MAAYKTTMDVLPMLSKAMITSEAKNDSANPLQLPDGLLASIKAQRAVLFLGAGASREGQDQHGKKTLSASELKDALCLHFLNRTLPDYDLMLTVEMLISEHGENLVFEYIRNLLDSFQPSTAHNTIPKFRWRAIATTNYDLLIERAYSHEKNRLQDLVSFVRDNEPFEEKMQQKANPLRFFKLHGCINHAHDTGIPLILSPEHYDQHLDNRESLFTRLKDLALESPIIFCGYSLNDPHIRSLLYRLSPSQRPSFYLVAPYKDDLEVKMLAQKKVEVINMTFGQFMHAIDTSISPANRILPISKSVIEAPIRKHYRSNVEESKTLKLFLERDVKYIYDGMDFAEQNPKDFYKGIDTGWGGIVCNFDVPRKVTENLIYNIIENIDEKQISPKMYILKGPAGNGKTIALKRAAWEISNTLEQIVLWCEEHSAIEIKPLLELYELTGKPIYLCVDRIALHAQKVRRIYEEAKRKNVPLNIIGAERDSEWHTYCSALQTLNPEELAVRYLSPREINGLLDRLNEHDSLGSLIGKGREEQYNAFENTAERQLLVALHAATLGKSFQEIVFDEYSEIVPDEARQLYLDVCTLNQFAVPVRAGTLSRVSGIGFDQYQKEIFGPLKNIIFDSRDPYTGDYQYKARHARVANLVFKSACETSEERADQLISLIQELDIGYSSDRAAIERITKGDALVDTLNVEDGRRLYETVVDIAPEEAFVYQQQALFESKHKNGSLSEAQSKIDKARSLNKTSKAIIHTQAEIARKRAKIEKSQVLKDQYRRLSRERLSEMKASNGRFVLSSKAKLALDELEDLINSNEEHEEYILDKVRSIEAFLEKANQLYPDELDFSEVEARLRKNLSQRDLFLKALEKANSSGKPKDVISVRLSKAYRAQSNKDKGYQVLDRALEKSPDSKILHFTYAHCLLEDDSENHQKISEHLIRSYDGIDNNYAARHLHAQFLFLIGEKASASKLFEQIDDRAPEEFSPSTPNNHSVISRKLTRYNGSVLRKLESYIFLSLPGYPHDVFAHEQATPEKDWNELEEGMEVEFSIKFNRKGPVAVGVKSRY